MRFSALSRFRIGLPRHMAAPPWRMAQDSNLPTACTVTSGFQPGALPARPAILARKVLGSNQRATLGRDLGLANRRLTARPTFHARAGRDSNPHVRGHTVLSRARLPLRHQRLGSAGIPSPTLAIVSRSAHGSARYGIPCSRVLGAGLPCHRGDAALRAGRCCLHPKGFFMLAPADPGYRLLPTPRITC
jgi:hypothetical protein